MQLSNIFNDIPNHTLTKEKDDYFTL
jgi:hypothetical protein